MFSFLQNRDIPLRSCDWLRLNREECLQNPAWQPALLLRHPRLLSGSGKSKKVKGRRREIVEKKVRITCLIEFYILHIQICKVKSPANVSSVGTKVRATRYRYMPNNRPRQKSLGVSSDYQFNWFIGGADTCQGEAGCDTGGSQILARHSDSSNQCPSHGEKTPVRSLQCISIKRSAVDVLFTCTQRAHIKGEVRRFFFIGSKFLLAPN